MTGNDHPSDESGEYTMQAFEAGTRRETLYWDLQFLGHVLVRESSGLLRHAISEWVSWRVNLITGRLPTVSDACCIQHCTRDSAAYVRDNKSWTDSNPVCKRHFIAVKMCVYSASILCLTTLVSGLYLLRTV